MTMLPAITLQWCLITQITCSVWITWLDLWWTPSWHSWELKYHNPGLWIDKEILIGDFDNDKLNNMIADFCIDYISGIWPDSDTDDKFDIFQRKKKKKNLVIRTGTGHRVRSNEGTSRVGSLNTCPAWPRTTVCTFTARTTLGSVTPYLLGYCLQRSPHPLSRFKRTLTAYFGVSLPRHPMEIKLEPIFLFMGRFDNDFVETNWYWFWLKNFITNFIDLGKSAILTTLT